MSDSYNNYWCSQTLEGGGILNDCEMPAEHFEDGNVYFDQGCNDNVADINSYPNNFNDGFYNSGAHHGMAMEGAPEHNFSGESGALGGGGVPVPYRHHGESGGYNNEVFCGEPGDNYYNSPNQNPQGNSQVAQDFYQGGYPEGRPGFLGGFNGRFMGTGGLLRGLGGGGWRGRRGVAPSLGPRGQHIMNPRPMATRPRVPFASANYHGYSGPSEIQLQQHSVPNSGISSPIFKLPSPTQPHPKISSPEVSHNLSTINTKSVPTTSSKGSTSLMNYMSFDGERVLEETPQILQNVPIAQQPLPSGGLTVNVPDPTEFVRPQGPGYPTHGPYRGYPRPHFPGHTGRGGFQQRGAVRFSVRSGRGRARATYNPNWQEQTQQFLNENTKRKVEKVMVESAGSGEAGEMPKSLMAWVARSLSNCRTSKQKDVMEDKLKEYIGKVMERGDAGSHDWENEPLMLVSHSAPDRTVRVEKDQDDGPKVVTVHLPFEMGTPKPAIKHDESDHGRGYSSHRDRVSYRDKGGSGGGIRPRRDSGGGRYRRNSPGYRHRSPDYHRRSPDYRRTPSPPGHRHRVASHIATPGSGSKASQPSPNPRAGDGYIPLESGRARATRAVASKTGDKRPNPMEDARKAKRAARFHAHLSDRVGPKVQGMNLTNFTYGGETNTVVYEGGLETVEGVLIDKPIVGTSLELTKDYLRLTTAPDAHTVRPLPVLKRALIYIKRYWKESLDYKWTCDQLKSARQDLTVQCIRNEFSVEVYETHARIALEKGDREEFNQCQTQLKSLYTDGVDGNVQEFTAYLLLYCLFTNSVSDLMSSLSSLDCLSKMDPCINHALKLRKAWCIGNYHRFFILYRLAPKMSGYVIDWFVPQIRLTALKHMIKSYRPNLEVSVIERELSFENPNACLTFLQKNGISLSGKDLNLVDCRINARISQSNPDSD